VRFEDDERAVFLVTDAEFRTIGQCRHRKDGDKKERNRAFDEATDRHAKFLCVIDNLLTFHAAVRTAPLDPKHGSCQFEKSAILARRSGNAA